MTPKSPMHLLRDLFFLERHDLRRIALFALFSGLLSLATPVAAQALIDTVALGVLLQPVVVLSAMFMVALVLGASSILAQRALVEWMSERLWVRTANKAHDALTSVHQLTIARLSHRFFDVVTVDKSLTAVLVAGISASLQVASGLLLLAVYHPFLLALDFLLVFTGALAVLIWWKRANTTAQQESSAKFSIAHWFADLEEATELWSHTRAAEFAKERTQEVISHWLLSRQKHFKAVIQQQAAFLALQVASSTLVLLLGGFLVLERELALGQLVAAEVVVALTVTSLAKLGTLFEKLYDLLAGLKKLEPLSEGAPNAPLPHRAQNTPLSLIAESVIVSAQMQPISFQIDAGQTIGITGPECIGKTRLLQAIVGRAKIDSGTLWVGGDNASSEKCLRDIVEVSSWPPVLPSTLWDNITLGSERTRITAWQALEQVGLKSWSTSLEDGLDSPLNPLDLSHTQRIRLAFARALMVEPELVIVDGALDIFSTQERFRLLKVLKNTSSTVMVVSYQDDILDECDSTVNICAKESL